VTRGTSVTNGLWSRVEGRSSAYPLALFRLCFYAGLLLHFGPSVWDFEASYGPAAIRSSTLPASWLRGWWELPPLLARALALLPWLAALLGGLGGPPRVCAGLAGLGFYWLSCVNSLDTTTLALPLAWMTCAILALLGGGNEVLSVPGLGSARETRDRFSSVAIAVHLCAVVFLAGLEKLRAGWWRSNEMAVLLRYPRGIILRAPFAGMDGAIAEPLGWALGGFTLLAEVGAPLLLLTRKTRPIGITLLLLLFAGVAASMQVPPLFLLLYAGLLVLLVEDQRVDDAVSRFRRWGQASALRWWPLAVLLILLPSCSRDSASLPPDDCARTFPSRCDPRQESCQEAVFAHVLCLAGSTELMERPPTRVVPPVELARRVSQAAVARFGVEQLRRGALQLLGLAAAGEASHAPLTTSSRAGLYDYDAREVVLSEEGGDAWVLLHEYVHALQDHDGRVGIALSKAVTLDEELALRASLEGEATLHEMHARAHDRGPADSPSPELLRERARTGTWLAAGSGSVLDSATSSFVYAHGVAHAARRAFPAHALIDVQQHLEQQRAGTRGILAGLEGWEPPPAADVGPGPRRVGDAELQLSDRIGAWMIQMLLARSSGSRERSSALARGYRGDWLGYYAPTQAPDAGQAPKLALLEVRWSSEALAAEAKSALERTFVDREKVRVVVLPPATTLLIASDAPVLATELSRWVEASTRP